MATLSGRIELGPSSGFCLSIQVGMAWTQSKFYSNITCFHAAPNVQGKSLSLIEAGIVRDNNGYKVFLLSIFRQCTARSSIPYRQAQRRRIAS